VAAGEWLYKIAALMAQINIQQTFDLAMQHHQSGQLREAERLYRQILAQQPEHAVAMHFLGVVAHQMGRKDAAEDLIRRAIALRPNYAEAHFNLGKVLKDKRQLDEAIAAYRRAIALNHNLPEAHNRLANALSGKGQFDEAIVAYRQAIALRPNFAEAHSNLGAALIAEGQIDEAIAACRQAIALRLNYAEAHYNLGRALKDKGQLDEAVASYRQAIALKPNYVEAQRNLGNALRDKGQVDEAINAHRQAVALGPNLPQAHSNLGNALRDKGQLDEAINAHRRAITLRPGYAEAYYNLGIALHDKGEVDDAIAAYRQAISLKSDYAEAHYNLGIELHDKGQLDDAIVAFRQAITLKPNLPNAHSNLGTTLKDKGQLDEAIAAYRQALALNPNLSETHSNLIFVLHYHPACDVEAIAEEHRRWNHQHAEPLKKFIQPPSTSPGSSYANIRNPERRLRIGYVSADFCEHALALLFLPLLRHHDSGQCEVICYSNVPHPDAMTKQMQDCVAHWREIKGLSDSQVAGRIREDGIDILVDLSLHTAGNRLQVLARKPAPVQATWMLPSTTGLDTIDYRLTDPYMDPPGSHDAYYSERSIYLPDTFWCYDPLISEPAINGLPAQSNGHVTFGCLNNFCKINEQVLQLWAKVLKTVDRSRLMIHCPEGSHRQLLQGQLQREGIDPDRIELIARRPRVQYLELYHRIDVGLDTFPYNGHTTSFDSFWMGVPVITLVGKTAVGRAGVSQLINLGLTELIAQTPDQYVQNAAELAGHLPRLAELRRTLRARMEASPLMDAARFARNIEAAYRQMWRTWCEKFST